jgi:hypothetical protein
MCGMRLGCECVGPSRAGQVRGAVRHRAAQAGVHNSIGWLTGGSR